LWYLPVIVIGTWDQILLVGGIDIWDRLVERNGKTL